MSTLITIEMNVHSVRMDSGSTYFVVKVKLGTLSGKRDYMGKNPKKGGGSDPIPKLDINLRDLRAFEG